ncbi:glycoside hydrolase family 16 protein [Kitasatospora sp. NBC_01560]|uniref:glycoside hydrolase family 16 protein n=1 Tax=Kitasatospora sp. NBC_01560 TaxID=2975965 RepID=UPI00386D493B
MRTPPRTVPRLLLALLGWAALASTALPAANPLRVALVGALVLAGPGTAALLGRPTVARTADGTDRLASASLAVAISTACATLVAVAFFLARDFSVAGAVAVLAGVTTLLAVLPLLPLLPLRVRRAPAASGSSAGSPPGSPPGSPSGPPPGPPRGPSPGRPLRPSPGPVSGEGPSEAVPPAPRRSPAPRAEQSHRPRQSPRAHRVHRGAAAAGGAALLTLLAACSGSTGSTGGSGPTAAGSDAAQPKSGVPAAPAAGGSWRLVFQDEFSGTTLDGKDWTTCYDWNNAGCTNAGNGERQWYQPGQAKVADNRLTLTAQRRTVTGSDGRTYPWVSGMISTGRDNWNAPPRHAFTYGYFAASLKVPANPAGFFPAFWLIPAATRGTPPEVDIAEFPNTDQYVHMNLHWRGADGSDQHIGQNWGPAAFSAGYHVFAVDWEPSAVTWYIDGREWFRFTDPSRIPNVAMEVVINLAVGYLELPPDTTDSATTDVQWVQVWQH